jgi:hypothetical protein
MTTMTMSERSRGGGVAVLVLLLALAAPQIRAEKEATLNMALSEVPYEQLLDVGIVLFDPGLDEEDESAEEDKAILPDVRKSEARYIPCHLKDTLEATGQWGAVRVLPEGTENVDVMITGEILASNGRSLSLRVQVIDATGRVWRDKKYKTIAEAVSYRDDDNIESSDPFQPLYNEIANDLVESRERLEDEELAELRAVTQLRFAVQLAPEVFGDYITLNRKGRYDVERLPSEGDPMMERIARLRESDYLFVDTLNEHYNDFYLRMGNPYHEWRSYSYKEVMALRQVKRDAWTKKIIGGLLIVGGAVAGGSSTAAQAAQDAAMIGGGIVLKEGLDESKNAKIHKEALKELAGSLEAEVSPMVVQVEGQTLRLRGSAESQYAEWRKLLRAIFLNETGLPVDPDTGAPVELQAAEAAEAAED